MKYRADIDGLRSIAVIPVILFHLGFNWVSGGYLGVDVFFVISGYLITTILLKDITSNSFSMKEFWFKRIKRILPAILSVIIITLLIVPFLIYKGDILSLTSEIIPSIFSYSNFYSWFNNGNYWGESAENSFFLHAWSLSVEEQFYIFFPFFLFLLHKFKLSITKWLITIITISLIAFLFGSQYRPGFTFYMLPTRAWELLSGGLLAVTILNKKIKNKNSYKSYFSFLGLILILSSYLIPSGNGGLNLWPIFTVIGTIFIIAFSSKDNFTGKFLSVKPLVFIGKISYSLYLWHWPIIVLFKTTYFNKFSIGQIQIISIILTIIFSILSYYLIENKTRKWKHTPKLVLFSIIFVIGYVILLKSPLINKVVHTNFNKTIFYGYFYNIHPAVYRNSNVYVVANNNDPRRIGIIAPNPVNKNREAYKNNGIITSSKTENPEIIVLGDSHGTMWAKTIDEITNQKDIKATFYTANGASPFFNLKELTNQKSIGSFKQQQRISYAKNVVSNLKKWKPKLLIIVCKWNSSAYKDFQNIDDLILLAKKLDTKVLILNQPPELSNIDRKNSAQYLSFLGYKPGNGNQYLKHESNIEKTNNKLKSHFSKYSNVTFFDVYSYFIKENNHSKALVIKDADVLYYDKDHLSYQGTTIVKNDLKKEITSIILNNNIK